VILTYIISVDQLLLPRYYSNRGGDGAAGWRCAGEGDGAVGWRRAGKR
jgi:hypothetical protein